MIPNGAVSLPETIRWQRQATPAIGYGNLTISLNQRPIETTYIPD